ncbi:MAG: polyprenol monophosphomannose synthase [Chitinispirillaceae bacterium]|nr:polyprenol monophosphomannose synthase [Chitinispirillaceae bacterium]
MDTAKTLIIIPTYNERENIVLLVPEIKKVLPGAHILIVDDASPDGTGACVQQMAAFTDSLFLVSRPKKEGLGRAYVTGFKWALEHMYEFIFEMDADFSHDPKYLPDFLVAIQNNDLVIGSRYISGVNVVNWPMSRLLLSYFGNLGARMISGIPICDCTGGFKCFRRQVLENIKLDKIGSSGYSFQVEMNYHVWRNGCRIYEIPIIFTDRQRGESKMSTKIVREALVLLWKLRFASFFKRK